jgi:RNA polymerase sigma-70 factor, ECF subfamily
MDPLPQRLTQLLEALAQQEKDPARPSSELKRDMLLLLPNLRAFAISLCGNPERADDLVQETVLKAWAHSSSFQEDTNLRAWLFTILRNEFLSEMRKKRREVADPDGKMADGPASIPAQQGHIDLSDVRKALDALPAAQREALVLVGAAGLSYDEAAAITGCAVGTVKSRVNRARLKLSEILGLAQDDSFGPDLTHLAIVGGGNRKA